MEEENPIPENIKYTEKWRELVLRNRKRGRDHEVLYDYLEIRYRKLSERGIKEDYNSIKEIKDDKEFFDSVFSELEEAILSRLSKRP